MQPNGNIQPGRIEPRCKKRDLFGWAMYDSANSGYTTVAITAVLAAYLGGMLALGISLPCVILAGGRGIKADSFVSVTMLIIAAIYGAAALVTFRLLKEKGKSNLAVMMRGRSVATKMGKPQINRKNRLLPL